MSMPRCVHCVATGIALSVSSCIVYGLSGDVHYFTFGEVESHLPRLFPVD